MKRSLNTLLALMAVLATPAFAEQYVLHVQFQGNPCAYYNQTGACNWNGLTMSTQAKITDGAGNSLPGLQFKCLTGAPSCINGGEKNDTLINGQITSYVYGGNDELVAQVAAGAQIIIDANLTAYNGAVKHVTVTGPAIPGKFAEDFILTSPDSSGYPANVGFVAWLTKK